MALPPFLEMHPSTSGSIDVSWAQERIEEKHASSHPSPTSRWSTPPPPYEAIHDSTTAVRRTRRAANVSASLHSRTETTLCGLGEKENGGCDARHSSADGSISQLREALQVLESKMATLMNERQALEFKLADAVRSQSPVHRLPDELIASIFVTGVRGFEEEGSFLLSTLMLVCRHWTKIAVDTPVLWSDITVSNHRLLETAKLRLARSRLAPLDISVDFNPRLDHASQTTQTIVCAMDMLRPSIPRWRTFSLVVPNRSQAHAALMRCKERAPLLENFTVHIFHGLQDDRYSLSPLPLFDNYTPQLHSCSFTSFNFDWDAALLSRLRVLKLGGYWNGASPSVTTILNILRACPRLEELHLRNMSDIDYESAPTALFDGDGRVRDFFGGSSHPKALIGIDDAYKPISLPCLTKMSFYYSGNLRAESILSHVTFPALEELELSYMDDVTPILNCLTKQTLTSLPLRKLKIESCFFSEIKLAMFLRRVPALRELRLIDADDVSSDLLKCLSCSHSSQAWICPKLQKLDLAGCTALDWDSVRTLIESRLPPLSRAFPRQHASPHLSRHSSPSLPLVSPSYSEMASPSSALMPPPPSSSFPISTSTVSASSQALLHVPRPVVPAGYVVPGHTWPTRLMSLDITRCHLIGKEMVQWLRVYVPEVRWEADRQREQSLS